MRRAAVQRAVRACPRDGSAVRACPLDGSARGAPMPGTVAPGFSAPGARAAVVQRRRSSARTPPRRGGSADLGRLVLALEALAPALDGRDELGEVDLERVEDLV